MSSYVMTNVIDATRTTNTDTLSSRLIYALNRLRVNQSELARRIGIKPQIIQYLCTSNANKSKFAYEIAIALEINPNWLIAGKGPMMDSINSHDPSSQPKIPLLTWNDIAHWLNKNINDQVMHQIAEFIFVNADISANSYALRIHDTSMIPRFEIGTTLVIDPSLEPKHGDFVIAKTFHQAQPIVRQYTIKAGEIFLTPINTAMYKEIVLGKEDQVLGVVRQTFFEFIR